MSESQDFKLYSDFTQSSEFQIKAKHVTLASKIKSPIDITLFYQYFSPERLQRISTLGELDYLVQKIINQRLKYNTAIKQMKVKYHGLSSMTYATPMNFNEVSLEIEPIFRLREKPFSFFMPHYSYLSGMESSLGCEFQFMPYQAEAFLDKMAIGGRLGARPSDNYKGFLRFDFNPFWTVEEDGTSWKIAYPSLKFQEKRQKYANNWEVHKRQIKFRMETDDIPRPRIFTYNQSLFNKSNCFYELCSESRKSVMEHGHPLLIDMLAIPDSKLSLKLGVNLAHHVIASQAIENVPSYLRYRDLGVNFKSYLEFCRISKPSPRNPDDLLSAIIAKTKLKLLVQKAIPGLYFRGLIRHESVFYHNSVSEQMREDLPLIYDAIHFNNFPGIAGQVTGTSAVYNQDQADPLGLNNFLFGSFKVFLTQSPQLPIQEDDLWRNQRTEFSILPFMHFNWGVDLSNRPEYGADQMGWLERIRKMKRARLSLGLGLSIQACQFAFNFYYTPFVYNPHSKIEGRQEFGISLGVDF